MRQKNDRNVCLPTADVCFKAQIVKAKRRKIVDTTGKRAARTEINLRNAAAHMITSVLKRFKTTYPSNSAR